MYLIMRFDWPLRIFSWAARSANDESNYYLLYFHDFGTQNFPLAINDAPDVNFFPNQDVQPEEQTSHNYYNVIHLYRQRARRAFVQALNIPLVKLFPGARDSEQIYAKNDGFREHYSYEVKRIEYGIVSYD